jgi:acid phosphatase family membrane protein YuiD
MNWLVIWAIAAPWILTRVIKLWTDVSRHRKFEWKMLFNDGGMPSSHTALSVGLAATMYLETGFSNYFFISLVLALIVMRDAMRVRRIVGEHSAILNRLLKHKDAEKLDERVGHTGPEVTIGAVIGVVVPWLLYALF